MEEVNESLRHLRVDEVIVIGPHRVEKSLLCNASKYFERALNGNFKESADRVLSLAGCSEYIMDTFVCWLRGEHIPSSRKLVVSFAFGSEARKDLVAEHQMLLIRMWSFADRVLLTRLQNETMQALLDLLTVSYIRAEAVSLAFETTGECALLRSVVVLSLLDNDNTTDDYGQKIYDEAARGILDTIPGLWSKYCSIVSKSGCGMIVCVCGRNCYKIEKTDEQWSRYMVDED